MCWGREEVEEERSTERIHTGGEREREGYMCCGCTSQLQVVRSLLRATPSIFFTLSVFFPDTILNFRLPYDLWIRIWWIVLPITGYYFPYHLRHRTYWTSCLSTRKYRLTRTCRTNQKHGVKGVDNFFIIMGDVTRLRIYLATDTSIILLRMVYYSWKINKRYIQLRNFLPPVKDLYKWIFE